jgi:MFS family permease
LSRYSPSALFGVADLPLAFRFAIPYGVMVLGWVLPSAIIPIQALKLLGDAQSVSAFFFGVGFVGLFGALIMPWLMYAVGRRAMLALCAVCMVIAAVLLSLDEAVSLIAGTAFRVLGFLCFNMAVEVAVMERIPRRDLVRFSPVRMFFIGIGLIIGPWLGVRLWLDLGLWSPFALLAVLTVGVCVYMLRVRLIDSPRDATTLGRPPNPLRFIDRFVRQPRLRLAWVLSFGRATWWAMFFIYAPIYCVQGGLGEEWAGIILSAGSAAVLLVPLWSRLRQRIGVRALLAIGYAATGVATIAITVTGLPWLGVSLLLAATIFASMIDAVGDSLFLRAVHPYERAEMTSVFISYFETAHLVTPGVLAALLNVFALPVVFLASGASLVAVSGLTRYIPRRF